MMLYHGTSIVIGELFTESGKIDVDDRVRFIRIVELGDQICRGIEIMNGLNVADGSEMALNSRCVYSANDIADCEYCPSFSSGISTETGDSDVSEVNC